MSRYGELIQKLIDESYDHMTAEEVFSKVKVIEPKVVQATIYNNLNRLTEEGKIRRLVGNPDRFDRIVPHDHLICRCCGKLKDLNIPDLMPLLEEQVHSKIHSYDLRVYYTCDDCANK